jgi:hypothetical protein
MSDEHAHKDTKKREEALVDPIPATDPKSVS